MHWLIRAYQHRRGDGPSRGAGAVQAGFSLLELTVSMVVGGMAVTGAAALLLGLGSRAEAIQSAALAVDRDANAERMIRLLSANLDASADTIALRGNRESVHFPTWCETGFAWYERCRVRLAFRSTGNSRSLVVERVADLARPAGAGAQPQAIVLREGLRSGHFLYLVNAEAGGKWSTSWSIITIPAALGVVVGEDTLILPLH
jgi:prepilin-type N-terminal cleavage/methylation domain-containing protein